MWPPAFDSTCTVMPLRSMSASRPAPMSVILSAALATTSGTLPATGDGAEGFWLPGISRLKCSSSVTVRIFSPGAIGVSCRHGMTSASALSGGSMKQLALAVGCAALAAIAIDAAVWAQEPFPTRPVQVIVPATAGGPVDTAVRMIAPALETALGQSVVLLNRPGASGTVGMHDVATAEPNGYTIGQGVNSIFTVTRI